MVRSHVLWVEIVTNVSISKRTNLMFTSFCVLLSGWFHSSSLVCQCELWVVRERVSNQLTLQLLRSRVRNTIFILRYDFHPYPLDFQASCSSVHVFLNHGGLYENMGAFKKMWKYLFLLNVAQCLEAFLTCTELFYLEIIKFVWLFNRSINDSAGVYFSCSRIKKICLLPL